MSDTAEEIMVQEASLPHEDFAKWMLKFLPRWHLERGQISGEQAAIKPQAGEMKPFKDTVPCEFRMWVKCYLARHYSNIGDSAKTSQQMGQAQRRADEWSGVEDEGVFQHWLSIFQTKWLQQQQQQRLYFSSKSFTSSDSDTGLTSDPDTDVEMNSSFKRMKLDQNNKKNVHFASENETDGDDSDADLMMKAYPKHKHAWKNVDPGFRRFAKRQLFQWDGVTKTTPEADNEEARLLNNGRVENSLPPHVYLWLSRFMGRMQKRKLKQEAKHLKKETKQMEKRIAKFNKKYNPA